jgi:hypothetical protein
MLPFLAPLIPDVIYGKYFEGKRMSGSVDPEFISSIGGPFICFTLTVLCHTLRAWRTGIYIDPPDFKYDTVIGTDNIRYSALADQLDRSL